MPSFAWQYPLLSIKAVNNFSSTEMLAELVLDIIESKKIDEPLLVVEDGSFNGIVFINEGWGEITNPLVNFSIRKCESDDKSPPYRKKHSIQIESFSDRSKVPIDAFIPELLENEEVVEILGEIVYGPPDRRKTLQFNSTVALQLHSGHAVPPSFTYNVCIKRDSGRTTYRIPISQAIRPGEADHFLLRIASDKSSKYRIHLVLKSIEGEKIAERDLCLAIFVPRSGTTASLEDRSDRQAGFGDSPSK
jgi:hypothetical protein